MLKNLMASLIFVLTGGILIIFAFLNKYLVLDNGILYEQISAPFGINYTRNTQLGPLYKNAKADCYAERRSSSRHGYKSYYILHIPQFAQQPKSKKIKIDEYTSMDVCKYNAHNINKLINQESFKYKLQNPSLLYLVGLVGFIFLISGLMVPFGKELTPENSKKIFGRELTPEEIALFRDTGTLPPDIKKAHVEKIQNFLFNEEDIKFLSSKFKKDE